MSRFTSAIAFTVAAFALAGCAGGSPGDLTRRTPEASGSSFLQPTADDSAALAQLDRVAAASAEVDSSIDRVSCWTPSRHLLDGSDAEREFKVICRVFYEQASEGRYKDMTCIGDFDETPMLTSCYRWIYYSDMPRFEDGSSFGLPSASP